MRRRVIRSEGELKPATLRLFASPGSHSQSAGGALRARAWRRSRRGRVSAPAYIRRDSKKGKKKNKRQKDREIERKLRGLEGGTGEKPRLPQNPYVLFAATNVSLFSFLFFSTYFLLRSCFAILTLSFFRFLRFISYFSVFTGRTESR